MSSEPPIRIALTDWADARAQALPLRIQVFVVEQGVPAEIEEDAFDPQSTHAIARSAEGAVCATGRLRPDGRIGRMAVDARWRGRGIGRAVLQALVDEAVRQGLPSVVLHAQIHAVAFYARQGFVVDGASFMEAGIEHCRMRRRLVAPARDER